MNIIALHDFGEQLGRRRGVEVEDSEGAATGRRKAVVRWRVAGRMGAVWLLTLPAAATVGGLAAWVARGPAGTVLVAAVAMAIAAVIYGLSRRKPVTAVTVNHPPAPRPVAVAARAAA